MADIGVTPDDLHSIQRSLTRIEMQQEEVAHDVAEIKVHAEKTNGRVTQLEIRQAITDTLQGVKSKLLGWGIPIFAALLGGAIGHFLH